MPEQAPIDEQPKRRPHPLEVAPPPGMEPAMSRPRPQAPPIPLRDRPLLTYALIVINVLIFVVGFALEDVGDALFQWGVIYPPLILREGEFYRLLTGMFLHADPTHIFFNAYALYIVGISLEPLFGRMRFFVIYILGGLAGSMLSVALGDYLVPSLGASGAVFAIFAAQALHFYQHRAVYSPEIQRRFQHMVIIIGINLALGFISPRIDNWGHIGGLIGGLILTWRLGPLYPRPEKALKNVQELRDLDQNPLSQHVPTIMIYSVGLVMILVFAVQFIGV